MEEIFKRILDALKGWDFWIALGFLAAGYVCWRWIGTKATDEKKVLRRQISAALLLALVAGGTMFVNHFFFLRERGFSKNLTGVLVTRIVGDDALDSLQGDLVEKLNAELQKEATGQQIEVHASSEMVNANNGLEAAHEHARIIGQRLNAKLVIWGRKIGVSQFYPRITLMAAPEDWSGERKRTHDAQNITEFHLPDELVDEPFYLIHFAAGYSYYIQDNYKEALPHFKAALGRKGALPKELPDLQFFTAVCQCSLDAGQESMVANLQEAIGLFEKAARIYETVDQKKCAMAQYNIGTLYNKLSTGDRAANLRKAIAAFDESIRLNPKYASAYYNRGNAYSNTKGDYAKAIADYDESIRLNPEDAEAYNNRGIAYHDKGDYEKAMADYNEAIQLNPNYPEAYNNRGNAYQDKGDHDKAMADYDESIRLNPKDADVYNNRGITYQANGDYAKAIPDFDESIRLNPKGADAYNNRGAAYQAKGDYNKAIADYDEVIRLNPNNANIYSNRGVAYKAKGDYAKAIADYDEVIRLNPQLAEAYNKLAWLLGTCMQASFRDAKKSVEYATKACELSEWKDANSVDTLAAARAEAGNFEQAIKWETKYLETPNLSEKDAADGKSRLTLYKAHKPYHEEK